MIRPLHTILASALLALAGSGCAQRATIDRTGAAVEPRGAASMSRNMAGGQMPMMDMDAMCNMHQKLMDAKTAEQRQALMGEHMKKMSPDTWDRRMSMLRENCP